MGFGCTFSVQTVCVDDDGSVLFAVLELEEDLVQNIFRATNTHTRIVTSSSSFSTSPPLLLSTTTRVQATRIMLMAIWHDEEGITTKPSANNKEHWYWYWCRASNRAQGRKFRILCEFVVCA